MRHGNVKTGILTLKILINNQLAITNIADFYPVVKYNFINDEKGTFRKLWNNFFKFLISNMTLFGE